MKTQKILTEYHFYRCQYLGFIFSNSHLRLLRSQKFNFRIPFFLPKANISIVELFKFFIFILEIISAPTLVKNWNFLHLSVAFFLNYNFKRASAFLYQLKPRQRSEIHHSTSTSNQIRPITPYNMQCIHTNKFRTRLWRHLETGTQTATSILNNKESTWTAITVEKVEKLLMKKEDVYTS